MIDFSRYFVGDPRAQQSEAMSELSSSWNNFDVFVLQLPVAVGKSKLGEAIIRGVASKRGGDSSGVYVTNNNMLLEQVAASTKGFRQLRAKDFYGCREGGNCSDRARRIGGHCRSQSGSRYDSDGCPYLRDLGGSRSARKLLLNQHAYLAHKLYRPVLVLDEAHTAQALLQEIAGRKLWRRQYGWPFTFETLDDVRKWLEEDLTPGAEDENTDLLHAVLCGDVRGYSVVLGEDEWRGKTDECIKLIAIDVRDAPPVLWPKQVEKIVLMSATISEVDVRALGLADGRRVKYIETDSPIPASQRPFLPIPVADLSYRGLTAKDSTSIDDLASFIVDGVLPAHRQERGFVHASYQLARELHQAIGPHPRIRWHSKADRGRLYEAWLTDGSRDSVFVGSGMHEGIDLHDDIARFQLLTATPRRSIADPGLLQLAESDPAQYEWLTIRELAQAYGRVTRSPTDYGLTICADSSVQRELSSSQVPTWLREAMITPGDPE